MKSDKTSGDIEIVPKLPSFFGIDWADDLPPGLNGSRIVRIGMPGNGKAACGGGLLIDYIPKGRKSIVRVVLEFNDAGMWIKTLIDEPS